MQILKPMTALATAMAFGALIAACGSKDASEPQPGDSPATAEAAAPATAQTSYKDACKLRMTAPDAREWQTHWNRRGSVTMGEGPSTVHSTYWAGDDERQALIDAKAPPLEVSCSVLDANNEIEIAMSIHGRGRLSEADVPFGPGTYQIVPRSNDENAAKGFWVWPLLYGGSMFEATSGTLTVARFDDKGVAGSFQFEGKEQIVGNRALSIEGTFDMPCRGGITERKCSATKAIVD